MTGNVGAAWDVKAFFSKISAFLTCPIGIGGMRCAAQLFRPVFLLGPFRVPAVGLSIMEAEVRLSIRDAYPTPSGLILTLPDRGFGSIHFQAPRSAAFRRVVAQSSALRIAIIGQPFPRSLQRLRSHTDTVLQAMGARLC